MLRFCHNTQNKPHKKTKTKNSKILHKHCTSLNNKYLILLLLICIIINN